MIIDLVLGAVGCAVLFAAFVLLHTPKECSGNCGACTGACPADPGES
jgi:heterodisulfide reductase subunit C